MNPDGTAEADELLAHLEAGLGRLNETRSVAESVIADELGVEFAVLAFGTESETSFATFGVSRHLLGSNRALAQEVVLAVSDFDFAIASLGAIGRSVLERHEPTYPGERHRLHGLEEPVTIGGVMAVPDLHVGRFAGASPPIDFMRLLPITGEEARYASDHGWEELAAVLDAPGVDLRDLQRDSVVRHGTRAPPDV